MIAAAVDVTAIIWRRDCRHGRRDRRRYRNRCRACVAETIAVDRRRVCSAVLTIIESERRNGHAIPTPDARAQEVVLDRVMARTIELQKEISA